MGFIKFQALWRGYIYQRALPAALLVKKHPLSLGLNASLRSSPDSRWKRFVLRFSVEPNVVRIQRWWLMSRWRKGLAQRRAFRKKVRDQNRFEQLYSEDYPFHKDPLLVPWYLLRHVLRQTSNTHDISKHWLLKR